jgi:hypothetical protein
MMMSTAATVTETIGYKNRSELPTRATVVELLNGQSLIQEVVKNGDSLSPLEKGVPVAVHNLNGSTIPVHQFVEQIIVSILHCVEQLPQCQTVSNTISASAGNDVTR